jgi:hydroxymethylpyrimidine/phosphomethylpyrimidine kinase
VHLPAAQLLQVHLAPQRLGHQLGRGHRHAALREFHNPRVDALNTHGSGCTLSAAIAAKLALGLALEEACAQAIAFLHEALRAPLVLDDGTRLIGIER